MTLGEPVLVGVWVWLREVVCELVTVDEGDIVTLGVTEVDRVPLPDGVRVCVTVELPLCDGEVVLVELWVCEGVAA